MTLPLPFVVKDEDVQGNFDEIKKQFPISRRNMAVEQPHVVGDIGEPAFQNGWSNYDTTAFRGARFWKDPMGIVHVEGLVKGGTAPGAGITIFALPAGYRPGIGLIFAVDSNSAHGRADIAPTGEIVARIGNAAYMSLNGISFKQEN